MKDSWNISEYQILQEKNKKPFIYISIIGFLIIGISIIICKFNFKVYINYQLIKKENEYLLIANSKQINSLKTQNTMYIKSKKHKYKILKIEEDYMMVENEIYQTVYIEPYNYQTDAVLTECSFLVSSKTILTKIVEFIEGG